MKTTLKTLRNLSYLFSIAFLLASLVTGFVPVQRVAAMPAPQLQLSHIVCLESGQVEIHFILNNVPDGATVGGLTYTLSDGTSHTIGSYTKTGGAYHFSDYVSSGYYNVTGGSVSVNGTSISLHNPGVYAGTYTC